LSLPVTLTPQNFEEITTRAVQVLRQPGGVVLLPTETVYGLVCRACDPEGVNRIYELKHRDCGKPLAWFIDDWRKLDRFGVKLEGLPAMLADKYCPGPITVIAPMANGKTVGFRTPDHPLVLAILRRIDFPLASTSANLSGRPNALSARAALAELSGTVDYAIDGGDIPCDALASTVVDATGTQIKILRQGPLQISI